MFKKKEESKEKFILKTYSFALYPNRTQETALSKQFGLNNLNREGNSRINASGDGVLVEAVSERRNPTIEALYVSGG